MGGGFGHIGRCLALAAELKDNNWQTLFAMAGHHVNQVSRAGHTIYPLHRPYVPRPETDNSPSPAYTAFSDMNYQIVRDGLWNNRIIRGCVAEQLKIIHRFQPDVLIADTWPLASTLAYITGLPLVQIIKSILHPASPNLIWWQEPPAELVSPNPAPVINPLLKSWGIPSIQRAEDLLTGDLYLVPSFPELDPLPPDLPNTHYIGPLIRPHSNTGDIPDWLNQFEPSKPLIYVTMGGGAGPVGALQFYKMLMEALGNTNLQVIVSTSAKLSPSQLPTPPPNIRLEPWVPGPAVIARSNLVVYHGGYGTSMELVQAGVPSLIIPFHSEQESNARRLEAAGAARVLAPDPNKAAQVWKQWPGGRFSMLIHQESGLTSSHLRSTIMEMLADETLPANAKRLQTESQNYRGAPHGVDLIEELINSKTGKSVRGWDNLKWWQKLSLRW